MALDGWDVRPWRPTIPGTTPDKAGTASVKEAAMSATISPMTPTQSDSDVDSHRLPLLWMGFVLASLLALDVLDQTVWSIAVPLAAGTLWLGSTRWWRSPSITRPGVLDGRDLAVIAVLYLAVVGLWRLAFTVFTADRWLGRFLCFGGGMLLGVVGPGADRRCPWPYGTDLPAAPGPTGYTPVRPTGVGSPGPTSCSSRHGN
jgi:hypothetical protein